MADYCTRADIETLIPPPALVDGLDDDGDGTEDAGLLADIIEVQANRVDAALAGRYTVPFTTVPALVRQATIIFVAHAIYARRPTADKNPFAARAKELEERLTRIGAGMDPLDASTEAAYTRVRAVTEAITMDGGTA